MIRLPYFDTHEIVFLPPRPSRCMPRGNTHMLDMHVLAPVHGATDDHGAILGHVQRSRTGVGRCRGGDHDDRGDERDHGSATDMADGHELASWSVVRHMLAQPRARHNRPPSLSSRPGLAPVMDVQVDQRAAARAVRCLDRFNLEPSPPALAANLQYPLPYSAAHTLLMDLVPFRQAPAGRLCPWVCRPFVSHGIASRGRP